ncbi:hypothetical protein ACHAAC_05910 [Aeromicrobium sp. CF4.19]|uniref:hypothetical protein n=1 Tax=Aeromicrobium sp. CF4.19 TaxID=3373082 RepID=UPI003EE6CAF6
MPRRVNLPGADELFRSTARPSTAPADEPGVPEQPAKGGSGRVKHDEKMTVYVTSEELMAIEQARLALRSSLARNVDRGRLVRAALSIALEDLQERGVESDVARRLGSP